MAARDEVREALVAARDNGWQDPPPAYQSSHSATYYPQRTPHTQSPSAPSLQQLQSTNTQQYPTGMVTVQPRPIQSLSEASIVTLQSMHRSSPQASQRLDTLLGNLGTNMEIRAAQDISLLATTWDYGGLVNSLLLPEEEITTGDDEQIQHVGAWIKDEGGTVQEKLPKGRLILTNKRLLFVACGTNEESELTREGQHGVYIYYTLSTAATDAVSFSSVPIRNVRSVFLSAEAKSTWSSRIKGLLACASLCFHGDETTQWSFDQPSQTVREHRVVLNIGAVLPPFGKAVAIDVHLESSFSIRTATAFVAKLQPYVPEFN